MLHPHNQAFCRLFPEVLAGGYSRLNGTIAFYTRINSLLHPQMHVLDFGAGRGAIFDDPVRFKVDLAKVQGKVAEVVGVDVDPQVLQRPYLDQAMVVDPGQPLPFSDGYFDLIYSDWVLEHVTDPVSLSAEINRLLRPGGWFCARTPNRWGFTGLATRSVPNSLHLAIVRRAGIQKNENDHFPTAYRLNSIRQLRKHFAENEWDNYSFAANFDPPYVQNSILAMRLLMLVWRFLPDTFATELHVFLRKRA